MNCMSCGTDGATQVDDLPFILVLCSDCTARVNQFSQLRLETAVHDESAIKKWMEV